MLETSPVQPRALSATRLVNAGAPSRGQEARRGLLSFLTWPFFLGMLIGLREPAAGAAADDAGSDPAPDEPADDSVARSGALPPVATGLSDWETGEAVPNTYLNLLTPPYPAVSAPASAVEAPEPAVADTGTESVRGGAGGGNGGGTQGSGAAASGQAPDGGTGEVSLTLGTMDLGELPVQLNLDLGQALPISGVLDAIALDPLSDVLNGVLDKTGLPILGGSVADVGESLLSILGDHSDAPPDVTPAGAVELGEPIQLTDSGDVSSGGTLHFRAPQPGSGLDPLYAEGRYTDYGVTFKTSLLESADANAHGDAGLQSSFDLGYALHSGASAEPTDHHADTTMRSPLDVLS